jgi:hypothetical protein
MTAATILENYLKYHSMFSMRHPLVDHTNILCLDKELENNLLNHRLFQKLKLIENDKFNHLINTFNTSPHMWVQTLL